MVEGKGFEWDAAQNHGHFAELGDTAHLLDSTGRYNVPCLTSCSRD
jgi:hypothetical protein